MSPEEMATAADRRDELELGQYIPLHYHFNMLDDAGRTGGFEQAIAEAVRPGARVVELGGGTGVLSFFASRAAARVWCVERNPELATAARRLLEENGVAGIVEVVEADAREFLPPEPVDVVICEMLHTGLLREKQLEVVASFKERYLARFPGPLPRFVPEAVVQAVQPLQQSYDFHGYWAPAPLFQQGTAPQPRTVELGAPEVFQSLLFEDELPAEIAWDGVLRIEAEGLLNALRLVTKNLLAIVPRERRTIDWLMHYLVVPLAEPLAVRPGDAVDVSFAYPPGGRIADFAPAVRLRAL
jgi:protein arginine N-methyltransferase 1